MFWVPYTNWEGNIMAGKGQLYNKRKLASIILVFSLVATSVMIMIPLTAPKVGDTVVDAHLRQKSQIYSIGILIIADQYIAEYESAHK